MDAKHRNIFIWAFALVLILVTACSPSPSMAPASSSDSSSAPAAPAAEIGGPGGSSFAPGSSSAPGGMAAAEPTAILEGYPPAQASSSGVLTAGEVDDLLNFAFFQRYAARKVDDGTGLPAIPTRDRVTLRIFGSDERPLSSARVRITPINGREEPFITYAGTDGRLVFFPTYDFNADDTRFRIEVSLPGENEPRYSNTLDLSQLKPGRTIDIQLSDTAAPLPSALDLMLVIDTTGSMSDELNYLTREFQGIIGAVRERFPNIDMRFGLVVYRDQGDEYVVRSFGFTGSSEQMQEWLAQQRAAGGGDEPEAVPDALQAALDAEWRSGNTARVLLHVADAPAHSEAYPAFLERIRAFRARGIRIYPVAASGVNPSAEYLMRNSALLTQGRYLFLTDDSGVGNSHAEPVIPCYVVTHLNNLIERVVLSELSGKRVEPSQEEIIRVNGNYQNGVCPDD